MRFLCLHGKGTSAAIFQSQTTAFRSKLSNEFTFDFVDGFLSSDPAPGVDLFYPPPYYSFWNTLAIADVRKSLTWLRDYIAKNGPYDGVMCFSQGCSLIASFCLYHEAETPNQPLPFKVAIFICGGVPMQVLEDLGIDVSQEAWDMNTKSSKALAEQASSDAILKSGLNRWVNADGFISEQGKPVDPKNVFGLNFEDMPQHLRITIPTVHVYGNKDPRCTASLQLAQFSDPVLRKTYDHGGGHDVPRKTEVSESIARMVEWTAAAASHVSRIAWALYENENASQGFSGVKDQETRFETGFGSEAAGDEPLSREVVSALRHNGVLLRQKRDRSLWTFTISHAEEETPKKIHKSDLNIEQLSGLQLALSGTITPGHLSSGLGLAPVESDSRGDNDGSSGAESVATVLKAKSDRAKHSIVYHEFTLALTSSVINVLAERGDRLSVGPDSCLRFLDITNSPNMVFSSRTALACNDDVEHLQIRVAWSPSGTLTIHGHSRRATGILRLSDILISDRHRDERSISVGHTVFVALSGASYRFVGTEIEVTGSVKADRKGKRSILAWLASCGMHIALDSLWVYLRSGDPSFDLAVDQSLPHERNGDLMLWPARACFTRNLTRPPINDEVLQRISRGTFVDPLTKVEQWFLGRSARAEAAERRRQEDEERKFREIRKAESLPVQLDDTSIDRVTHTGQYLSAQEASGIYPTPPDGMAALTQGSFEAPDTGAGATETIRIRPNTVSLEAIIEEAHTTDADSLGVDIPGRRAQGHDLFGGLDTDMFDTNDLTEADFNFFDEPDDEPDPTSIEGVLPGVQCKGTNAQSQQSAREMSLEDPQTDTSPVITGGQTNASLQEADAVIPTHNASPDTPSSDQSKSVASEHTSTISFAPDNSNPSYASREPVHRSEDRPTAKDERSTFKYVSPQNGPRGFDEKYRDHGKYATIATADLEVAINAHGKDAPTRELPRIGMFVESSDPSTVSTDEMHDLAIERGSPLPVDPDVLDTSRSRSGSVRSEEDSKTTRDPSKKHKRGLTVGSDRLATPARSDDFAESSLDDPSHHDTTAKESHLRDHVTEDLLDFLDGSSVDTGNVFVGNDQNFIQIAQLVADQKILQNDFLQCAVSSPTSPFGLETYNEPEGLVTALQEALENILSSTKQCNLKSLSDLDAGHATNVSAAIISTEKADKPGQPQQRSRVGKTQVDALQKSQVPYLSVQRGKDAMEVLPPALYFWEELGFSPVQRRRDAVAFIIYPNHDTVREAASSFLMSMENSYQSCRFGRHTRGAKLGDYDEGLVALPVSSADPKFFFKGLDKICESIGTEISIDEADGSNYIIYVVNPFNDEAMLPHMCHSFFQLSHAYAERVDSALQDNAREVILQVVPISFLVNCDRLTFPPPKAYTQLAFEVYSRCNTATGEDEGVESPYASSAAVRLAKPIPRAVNFHLGSRPTPPLAHDPLWRMHSGSIFQQRVTVILLSIDTHPQLSFASTQPTGPLFLPFDTSSPEASYDQVTAPETTRAPAGTPTASGFTENDPSARLVDIVSETWAMISPIPATDPYLPPTNLAHVLMSAYLLKRAGPEETDGLVPLGINLISFDLFKQIDTSSANTKSGEKVLREVFGMYSDLATLARSRGIEAWKRGVLPWHIAAARKGKRAIKYGTFVYPKSNMQCIGWECNSDSPLLSQRRTPESPIANLIAKSPILAVEPYKSQNRINSQDLRVAD
ncbi:MAG: hypothetical protein Q9194_002266 [Teloschistes cf. exilis]